MDNLNLLGKFCGFWGVMIIFFVSVLAACGIGFCISSFVLISPIRRFSYANKTIRVAEIIFLSLVSLSISFAFSAAISAEFTFSFGNATEGSTSDLSCVLCPIADRSLKNELTQELWLKNLVPPPFQKDCYSFNPVVCDVAKDVLRDHGWSDFSGHLIFALCSMLASIISVWKLTLNHTYTQKADL